MERHGYTGYVENWMYAYNESCGTETIGSYEHLGLDFLINVDDDKHTLSGKKWRYVYVWNLSLESPEAICGYIFDENSPEQKTVTFEEVHEQVKNLAAKRLDTGREKAVYELVKPYLRGGYSLAPA